MLYTGKSLPVVYNTGMKVNIIFYAFFQDVSCVENTVPSPLTFPKAACLLYFEF